MFVIARPIKGISLNRNEYLEKNGKILKFKTKEKCLAYIKKHVSKESPEDYVWELSEVQ